MGFFGGKSSLSFRCVLSRCLAGPLSCSSLLYKGCCNHVYQPELSTETCQYYECLCIQETLFVRSPGIAVNALLALPLNYWDILFILLPFSPKPTTFWKCVTNFAWSPALCPLSSLVWDSFLLGTAALRTIIQVATLRPLKCLRRWLKIKLERHPVC